MIVLSFRWYLFNTSACLLHLSVGIKVLMKRYLVLAYSKRLGNDEEWRLFYCDSILGCRVIKDFDVCKLDEL